MRGNHRRTPPTAATSRTAVTGSTHVTQPNVLANGKPQTRRSGWQLKLEQERVCASHQRRVQTRVNGTGAGMNSRTSSTHRVSRRAWTPVCTTQAHLRRVNTASARR